MGLNTQLTDITTPFLAYACVGGFIVFFTMISLLVKEKLYAGEALLATAFGIIIGPLGADIFNPRSWDINVNTLTLELMRIALATGVFTIGVELPQAYLASQWKNLAILVVPTMAMGWVISAAFMYWLFPGLSVVSALCISACLTPTDPILSVAICSGTFAIKHVPVRLRRLIAAESAANDGMAYPFLSLALYFTLDSSRRSAIGNWFLVGWLYEVILGVVLGALTGLCFCEVMKYALKKGFIDKESYLAQYIALVLLTIGITGLLGSDDLLAAFAAGTAVAWDGHFKSQTENAIFSTVIDLVLNCVTFIYIGAWLPFGSYNSPELNISIWRLLLLLLSLLAFRRILPLLVLYKWMPGFNNWKEAIFTGHFGPMGVGAIYISTLAMSKLQEPQMPPRDQQELLAASLYPIVSFIVLGSILVHGLSIPLFSLGGWIISLTCRRTRSKPSLEWIKEAQSTTPDPRSDSDEDTLEQGTPTEVEENPTCIGPETQRK